MREGFVLVLVLRGFGVVVLGDVGVGVDQASGKKLELCRQWV